MRMKILKIVVVLLLSGSGEARPQKTEESGLLRSSKTNPEEWRTSSVLQTVPEDSRIHSTDTRRNLKDLQHIDQSLRTVATQLLNVSNPEEPAKILDNVIKKPILNQKPIEVTAVKEITANNNGQSVSVGFRPINSKFNYFETSHPGQAMAITEEELEKEMSSTRLMTAYKNHPTTTGGISTWILLNPPSTTMKTPEAEKKTKQPFEAEVRMTVKPTTLMERIDTTERVTEKVTVPVLTTVFMEEPATTKKPMLATTKRTTESKPQRIQTTEKVESLHATTVKVPQTTMNDVESKEVVTSTTKKVHLVRTTSKPKTATAKTTALSKNSVPKTPRPNQQNRPKVSFRRTTVKPDVVKDENVSTAKIEKVTFRPVQIITTTKSKAENTEKPMFVTKIKASVLMDTQKTTTQSPVSSTTSLPLHTTSKTTTVHKGPVEVPVKPKPAGTKVNNVLKVQLKKPLEDSTNIEIEPIKVNAAVLKIEKVEKEVEKEAAGLHNSRIDLMKFDFNPELTKVNVDTEAKEASSSTTTESSTASSTSTTKRPRNSTKRKKNKGRRRKPATSTTTTTTTTPSSLISTSTKTEPITDEAIAENRIQESKIVPETKVATNLTKTKKKPGSTPISMQIYNFLSREVMPSFGVMSLVGLGLGLASYFLYPFGGTVTRRNYELEPKYKYNFDEYGGNYGQNEEEVLSKVLQGMTNDEAKYPGSKDHDDGNYYRYQHYDGAYEPQTTKKNDIRYPSSSPMYRPENSNSVLKYKNTDYNRYSDAPSTPDYYDRPKQSEYVVGQTVPGSVNRQFVVGSVPKEYPPYDKENPNLSTTGKLSNSYEPTESGQVQFDRNVNQNFNFPVASVQNYGQVQTARPEETYEELEITPTAVAVEHGPRSLKTKRSSPDFENWSSSTVYGSRRKRDTVIQVIPSKRELEEEEKEEDLSNEILNIIDSALPGEGDYDHTKKSNKDNEIEDLDGKTRKRKEEEERIRLKESTAKSEAAETSTVTSSLDASATSSATSPVIKEVTDSPVSSSTTLEVESEGNTMSNSNATDEGTVEWIDTTTKKPTEQNGFNLFNFVKKIAEIKFRLGLTLLKHASEGFARYLGHVQKRINGEE